MRIPRAPVLGGDNPPVACLVEHGARHPRVELDIAPQIEPIGDMMCVAEHLGLRGVALAPAPFLLEFRRKHITVVIAFDVAARARIAIAMPDPADVVTGFKHGYRQPDLAQRIERAHPAEPRAYDNRIDYLHWALTWDT